MKKVGFKRLTTWRRVLREKLLVPQLVKFPAVYRIWRFITVFTRVHHLFLSWGRSIQFTLCPVSLRSIILLFSHQCLGFLSCLFPSGFPHQHPVCSTPLSHTCHVSFFFIDRPNIWWGVEIMMLLIMQSPQVFSYLVPFRPKYPQHMSLLQCERQKFHIHIKQAL